MSRTVRRLRRKIQAITQRLDEAVLASGPLWKPWPNSPQELAYHSPADVLGYGGAAGGGKSDVLLGLAATQHLRSLIFRREAKQGRGLTDRAREILGGLGRFNQQLGVWRDLPGGRQIEFGGLKNPGDEQGYRGVPHDFLGFDEADQFPRHVVRFLTAWLRTTTPDQRCRVVLTFNPPSTAEGRWLLDFFGPWLRRNHPRPAAPGELRWYATLPSGQEVERPSGDPFQERGETITPRSRTFIPALVSDNPALRDTGYVATLQSLPEPLRSQLLRGDMDAGSQDDAWQVIPTSWVEAAQSRWKERGHEGHAITCLGLDVAYGGDDQTVLAPRHRAWFARLEKHPGRTTPDGHATAALVVKALSGGRSGDRSATVNVDAIGYGASAYDLLKHQLPRVVAVVFSQGINRTDRTGVLRFVNVRAYAWWSMREALDPQSGDGLALPPDPELLADLTAPRWTMRPNGVLIESKDDVKDRLGRSPDCGDAVVLANLQLQAPGAPPKSLGGGVVGVAPWSR